jgi:hypothetical protein
MQTSLPPRNHLSVMEPRLLSLELEQWSTRPVGHITDESGATTEFDGWVSLAAALERICGGGDHEAAASDLFKLRQSRQSDGGLRD